MTWLYISDQFLAHETGHHPECSDRTRRIAQHLRQLGWFANCRSVSWQPATIDQLALNHDRAYIERLREFADRGGGRIEADTVVSPASFDVACWAAGAAIDAVDRVLQGPDVNALALVRPPGHHAVSADAMGFCLLNNVAIAARWALACREVERILIVDWDVHHGNGTQDAFWDDGRVGFLSIHRWPFYPGSGAADETGTRDGLGTTCNLPVAYGTSRREYLDRFGQELQQLAARMRPQLVLVSAGFDAHRVDPVGGLGLEAEDYAAMTDQVSEVAAQYADGKLVSLLEGGYHLEWLPVCVAAHLERLASRAAGDSPNASAPGRDA